MAMAQSGPAAGAGGQWEREVARQEDGGDRESLCESLRLLQIDVGWDSPQPLPAGSERWCSRNVLRKQRHWERIVMAKKRKRKQEKERRKAKRAEDKGVAQHQSKRVLKATARERLLAAKEAAPRLCVDLSMSSHMTKKETSRLAAQIRRLYGSNKKAGKPFWICLTGFVTGSPIYQECVRMNDGFSGYLMDTTPESYLDLFPVERIVYLTPDSENVLRDVDPHKVYVLGGLVDESIQKVSAGGKLLPALPNPKAPPACPGRAPLPAACCSLRGAGAAVRLVKASSRPLLRDSTLVPFGAQLLCGQGWGPWPLPEDGKGRQRRHPLVIPCSGPAPGLGWAGSSPGTGGRQHAGSAGLSCTGQRVSQPGPGKGVTLDSAWQERSLQQAQGHALQTARLPIAEYMVRNANARNYHSETLAINQVCDALVTYYATRSWPEALKAAVPPAKGYVLREPAT